MEIKHEGKAEENVVRDNVHSSIPMDSVNKETIVNLVEVFLPQAIMKGVQYSFFKK